MVDFVLGNYHGAEIVGLFDKTYANPLGEL